MAIRKFVAQTTREAMMQVRRELGEDAVILANKRVGNRIEVLAAAPDAVEALVERSESQSAALRERLPAAERAGQEERPAGRKKPETFQDFVRRQMQSPDTPQEAAGRPAPARGQANAARHNAGVNMYHDVAEIDDEEAAPAAPKPQRASARSAQAARAEPHPQRSAAQAAPRQPAMQAQPRATTIQASHRAPQVEAEPAADPAVFRRRPARVAPAPQPTTAQHAAAAFVPAQAARASAPAVAPNAAAAETPAARIAAAADQMPPAMSAGSASVPAIPAAARAAARPVDIDLTPAPDPGHASWMESAKVAIPRVETIAPAMHQPAVAPAAEHTPSQPQNAVVGHSTPQAGSQYALQAAPQAALQAVAQAAPQAVLQAVPQVVPPTQASAMLTGQPPVAVPVAQQTFIASAQPQPQAGVALAVAPMATQPQAAAQPVAAAVAPAPAYAPHAGAHVGAFETRLQAPAGLAPVQAPPPGWSFAEGAQFPAAGVVAPSAGIAAPAAASFAPALVAGGAAAQPPMALAMPAHPAQPRGVETQLLAELQSMRSLLQEQIATIASRPAEPAPAPVHNPPATRVMTRLLTAGFSVDVARRIAGHVPAASDVAQAEAWLHEVLARNIKCAGAADGIVERAGQPASPGQVVALVGPTGVGKTTTVAKLAARFAVKHGTSALGLVTLDAYRVAAPEQLRTYGRILGTPVHLAQDAASLRELMATMVHKRLVLIDTCGVSQRDQRLAEMLDLLAGAGAPGRPIQRVLLLNAASHAETLDEAARAWRAHECAGAILTKLDEASRIGGALDVSLRHRLNLLGLTNGQRVPEDWHGANAKLLAHLALKPAAQLFELADGEGAALAAVAQTAPAPGAAHSATHA